MKKFILTFATIIILLIGVLTVITVTYANSSLSASSTLPDNTTVNGVDCSNLSYEEAEAKITKAWNKRHIIIVGDLGEKLTSYTDYGYEYDLVKELRKARNRNLITAAFNHYTGAPLKLNITMQVSGCSEEFKKEVISSAFLNDNTAAESKDAYVDLNDPDFKIVHEIYGTKADTDRFFDDLTLSIQTGKLNLHYQPENYYTMPAVTSDDPSLIKYRKYCKKHLSQKITYMLGEESFTISAEQLSKLLTDDMTGNVDEAAVTEYVSQLAEKFDNVGSDRNFTSLSGKEVSVSGGTYGWEIDQEKEVAMLSADLKSDKDVNRKPAFAQEGMGDYTRTLGNTYIDVDISNQTVKFYEDGELIFSSSCVPGCRATGTTTDTGTYYILNKVTNVVLRGDNGDGTEYESPVRYWLGVNWAGEGFHDASWRSSFGGSIWKYSGSHGCINMPPARMGELYSKASVGIPVVVHY